MRGKAAKKPNMLRQALLLLLAVVRLAGTVFVRWLQAQRPASEPESTPIPTAIMEQPLFPSASEPEQNVEPEPAPTEAPTAEEPQMAEAPSDAPAQEAESPAADTVEQQQRGTGIWPAKEIVYHEESYNLVSEIVTTYRTRQADGAAEVRALLDRLREVDPDLGVLWDHIMGYWYYVNYELEINTGLLPEGLPMDDSLCIAVMGFQLNSDGSMAPELVSRCEKALACAQQYPNALIAVTGGGTAVKNKGVTEAGQMKWWFMEHGVAEERIIVEDQSMTTADNARNTCEILRTKYPQVMYLAIVSSSYHVPLGCLLFNEMALLYAYEQGELPFAVVANAAYETSSFEDFSLTRMQAPYVWQLADPSYGIG